MRRSLVAGVVVALTLAALPLAARALGSPAITLTAPSANDVVAGELSISWTYRAFSKSAWVDVEASRGDEPYVRIARVRIDDGTPGYTGSATWATGPENDAADYTIRVVVPSNKQARSSASPVIVDNTAPEMAEVDRTAANEAGWNNGDVTVRWACTDATSGPVDPEVTSTVVGEGVDLTATATCTDRAGHSTTATAEGIDIDRTAPAVTVHTNSALVDGTPPLIVGDVFGTASDSLSGVASIVVTFVDEAGNETDRAATCFCDSSPATWWTSTAGLAPGVYRINATATDVAGNATTSPTYEYFLVSPPSVPDVTESDPTPPTVAQPEVEQPEVEQPGAEQPDVTVPPVTVPPVTIPTVEPSV
jgi:hypothetical protein